MIEPPAIVREYWHALSWDAETLWQLELPSEPFPIERLAWQLDVPLWPHEDKPYQLTPRQVLRSPYRYAKEYRRMRAANLVFPIEITRLKGRWLVLDGIRRLTKAHEDGHETIQVRKVPIRLLARS